MLDGVHAVPDRRRAAVQALGVRGHPVAQPAGLVGDGGQLRLGELERLGVLELVGAGAGRHHLDEVDAGPDLFPDRAPDVVGAVRLPVHVAVEAPAGRRGRDDLPAGQQPGTAERAVAHGLPGLLRHQPLRPDHPDGGHAEAQVVAELRLQEVRRDPRQRFLGPLGGVRHTAGRVGVRVGQPRHQHPPTQVDRAGALRAPLPVVRDTADHAALYQDRRVLAQRASGAVEQPRPGQPEPLLGRGRSRDQRRKPMRHVVTTP